jgi:hypothetical protein
MQDEYVSGALHHVVLGTGPEGPLQPDTTYFYTCGDPDLGMSPEFSFRTPPVTGPDSLPYRQAGAPPGCDTAAIIISLHCPCWLRRQESIADMPAFLELCEGEQQVRGS